MSVKTYDPGQVIVIWGPHMLRPTGDGGVRVEPNNAEDWTLTKGINGEGARTRSHNQSARVTVALLQTDAANDALSAARNTDLLSGQVVYPLLVKDGSGRAIHEAEEAWLVGAPSAEYGREAGDREWVFEANSMLHHHGGN